MAVQVEAREKKLKQEVTQLRIEIDEAKRAKEVAEIADTDYFRDLQKKAREQRGKPKYEYPHLHKPSLRAVRPSTAGVPSAQDGGNL